MHFRPSEDSAFNYILNHSTKRNSCVEDVGIPAKNTTQTPAEFQFVTLQRHGLAATELSTACCYSVRSPL